VSTSFCCGKIKGRCNVQHLAPRPQQVLNKCDSALKPIPY
jgi:hypothetical protein